MDLKEFIQTRLESVDDLRTLLLFQAAPGLEMNANDLAGKLYLAPAFTEQVLVRLAAKGLLKRGGTGRYRYEADSGEVAALVAKLVELDRVHPVSLINMIYSRVRVVDAFADAFRIKKEKDK